MRVLTLGVLMVLGGCASGALPSFERFDVRTTPVASAYPDVPGVILLDRGVLSFSVDAERRIPLARLRRYRRIKVLRPSGNGLARIEVPYEDQTVVRGLIARTVQPNGDTDEARPPRDFAHASGLRALGILAPRVEPGSVIEYTYDVYFRDLRFLPPWVFQNMLPTERSEFAVVVPEGFDIDLRYSEDGRFVDRPPERFEIDGATRFSWSRANLPAQFPEPDMPAASLQAPRAHVLYRGLRHAGQTFLGFQSWDDVAAWQLARVPNWSELSDATVAEARRVAGDSALEERALKIMEVIARDLPAAAGPPPPLWRARPTHPDRVLAEQAADPTGRGMLLVALLRSAGIAAVPALFAYGDQDVLLPDAPTIRALSGVAAVLPRPTGALIMDPNQLTVSTAVASPRLQGTRIVLVRPDGAQVTRVPTSKPNDSVTEAEFTLSLDPSGNVTGTLAARLTGAEAGALRADLLAADPEAYAARASAFLSARGLGVAFESLSIADLKALRRPLSLRGDVSLPGLVSREGTEPFVRMGRFVGGPTEAIRPTRRSPLRLGAPRAVEIRGTLTLPEEYAPGVLPPAANHRFDGASVRIAARAQTARRIGFVREEWWPITRVEASRYGALYRFLQAVRASENEAFSVRRPPEKKLEY